MSIFSKRHYESIAKIIRREYEPLDGCEFVEAFVKEFKADNPRFDAERFRLACKP